MALDWLATARPLFTTLGPNVPWTRATIDERVAMAVEDGFDTVMAFVQDEGYALWPSRHAPVAPRSQGVDLVDAWVSSSHAAGLRFVAQWMGVHVQTVQAARHPGWLQRDASGTPTAAMCLNSAFGDALAGQVREVVERPGRWRLLRRAVRARRRLPLRRLPGALRGALRSAAGPGRRGQAGERAGR